MHTELEPFIRCTRGVSKHSVGPILILHIALLCMCTMLAQQMRACTIEGIAIARSGDPLPGATVDIAMSDDGPPIFGIDSVTLRADGNGRFIHLFKDTRTRAVDVHILVHDDKSFGEAVTSHAIVRPETALSYTIICGGRKKLAISLAYPEGIDPATDVLLELDGESGRRLCFIRTDAHATQADIELFGDWNTVSIVAYSMNGRPKTGIPWWSGWKYQGREKVTCATSVGAVTVQMNALSIPQGDSVRSFRVPAEYDRLTVIALDSDDTPIWTDRVGGPSSAHIDALSDRDDDTKSYVIRVQINDDVDRLLFMTRSEHLSYAHHIKENGVGIVNIELKTYEVDANAFHLLLPKEQQYLKEETAVTLRVWRGSYETYMYCPISSNGGLNFYLPPEFQSVCTQVVALSDNEFCDTGLSALALRGKTVEFDIAESQNQTILVSADGSSLGPQLITIRVGQPGTDNWTFSVQLNALQKLVVRLPLSKQVAIWNAGSWHVIKLENTADSESTIDLCDNS